MKDCLFRKKQVYVTPVTRLVAMDPMNMVCVSRHVAPNPGGSGNSSWDSDEEHDGGGMLIGEEEEGSSAKWSVWEEEE